MTYCRGQCEMLADTWGDCYAGAEEWTDAVQEEVGVCADTWWWTEIPLDVAGDTDLTTSQREVELELRTIGWDDQRSAVAAHTVEWKLMEVGELHQQWNPEKKGGEGDWEPVDAHLIQQGEKMVLHVPYTQDEADGCYVKLWVEKAGVQVGVREGETDTDAGSGLPNWVWTFPDESPEYVVKGIVAEDSSETEGTQAQEGSGVEEGAGESRVGARPQAERDTPTVAETEVYVIKKLAVDAVASSETVGLPATNLEWLLFALGIETKGWSGLSEGRHALMLLPKSSSFSGWANYEVVGGRKAELPDWLVAMYWLLHHATRTQYWWSPPLDIEDTDVGITVKCENAILKHDSWLGRRLFNMKDVQLEVDRASTWTAFGTARGMRGEFDPFYDDSLIGGYTKKVFGIHGVNGSICDIKPVIGGDAMQLAKKAMWNEHSVDLTGTAKAPCHLTITVFQSRWGDDISVAKATAAVAKGAFRVKGVWKIKLEDKGRYYAQVAARLVGETTVADTDDTPKMTIERNPFGVVWDRSTVGPRRLGQSAPFEDMEAWEGYLGFWEASFTLAHAVHIGRGLAEVYEETGLLARGWTIVETLGAMFLLHVSEEGLGLVLGSDQNGREDGPPSGMLSDDMFAQRSWTYSEWKWSSLGDFATGSYERESSRRYKLWDFHVKSDADAGTKVHRVWSLCDALRVWNVGSDPAKCWKWYTKWAYQWHVDLYVHYPVPAATINRVYANDMIVGPPPWPAE